MHQNPDIERCAQECEKIAADPVVEMCAKVCEELREGDIGRTSGEISQLDCAEAIRALPDTAGELSTNWPHDWPIEHTHQHVCSKCHTSYRGWEESDQCYACFRHAAPAAPQSDPSPEQIEAGRNEWEAIKAQEPHNMSAELIVSRIYRTMIGAGK